MVSVYLLNLLLMSLLYLLYSLFHLLAQLHLNVKQLALMPRHQNICFFFRPLITLVVLTIDSCHALTKFVLQLRDLLLIKQLNFLSDNLSVFVESLVNLKNLLLMALLLCGELGGQHEVPFVLLDVELAKVRQLVL